MLELPFDLPDNQSGDDGVLAKLMKAFLERLFQFSTDLGQRNLKHIYTQAIQAREFSSGTIHDGPDVWYWDMDDQGQDYWGTFGFNSTPSDILKYNGYGYVNPANKKRALEHLKYQAA